jgi:hypothetical protein
MMSCLFFSVRALAATQAREVKGSTISGKVGMRSFEPVAASMVPRG